MIKHAIGSTVLLLALLAGCAVQAHPSQQAAAVKPKAGLEVALTLAKPVTRQVHFDYLVYLPKDYDSDVNKSFPLVVFLHGAGERGTDVTKVAVHGPPKLVKQGTEYPFILLSPQCPADTWWNVDDLQVWLDEVMPQYRVDRSRVYVTGLSMGGGGTWDWIQRPNNPFAAAVPICGAVRALPLTLKDPLPVWAFHGGADPTVPLEYSQAMIDLYRQAGAETKLTIYPGVGHNSWDNAYNDPNLWAWLLSHTKNPPTTQPQRGFGTRVWLHPAATQPTK